MRKIVVKLMGGLGNQMFQLSAAKKVASFLGPETNIVFDTNFLEDRTTNCVHRNFDLDVFTKISYDIDNSANQSRGKIMIDDDSAASFMSNLSIRDRVIDSTSDIYLSGYFQNHQYVPSEMAEIFSIEDFYSKAAREFFESHFDNSTLMLSVRRGDYASRADTLAFHGFLGETYVKSAIAKFAHHEYSNVLIFSDEPDWCKQNLDIPNSVVVDHAYDGPKFIDKFHMMTKFRNMIIPNSTFSWWAAWLSEKRGLAHKIVCPGKTLWFSNSPDRASPLFPTSTAWQYIERSEL